MTKKKRQKAKPATAKRLVFGKRNWLALLAGVSTIVLGFLALSTGSITLAPILLVLGYCVIVPLAILIK
jgi:uncharacterized membrane protein HdeD (DUF308 family)